MALEPDRDWIVPSYRDQAAVSPHGTKTRLVNPRSHTEKVFPTLVMPTEATGKHGLAPKRKAR